MPFGHRAIGHGHQEALSNVELFRIAEPHKGLVRIPGSLLYYPGRDKVIAWRGSRVVDGERNLSADWPFVPMHLVL